MDVQLFTILMCLGGDFKNCMDVDLFGGMGYVGGDWIKV